MNQQPSSQ